MDSIIKEMAHFFRQKPYQIRQKIYRAYFNGETADLRIFNEVFGKEGLKTIAALKENYYPSSFLKILSQEVFHINGEEFNKKIKIFEKGESVKVLEGIEIKRLKNE